MTRYRSLLAGLTGVALLAAAAFAFAPSGIAPAAAQEKAMMLPADPEPLIAVTAKGEVPFRIEIADDPGERAMGLMFRKDLAADHGMLFVFEETRPLGFWMKNTPLPLDLVFVGRDGRVLDVQPGTPFSEAVIAADEPARFVLELNAGTAARSGIVDGVVLKHRAIAAVAGEPG
ncbi:DUF192 domain-containing protein [Aminobacter sp. HY435]|uniref:DUF192 domain-containing protein n=1 Tax=Aminobacter sp. HY435 TaxID=2970917 RepID=UPI0022B95242|nr:DUF192 domain-containing protein [Aminobacter sp. HY435]